jgi:hypothetical protein
MLFGRKNPSLLDDALTKALRSLNDFDIGSEEYEQRLSAVSRLHKMRQEEKPDQVSLDTAAVIAANLLGIVMIVRHENVNVIASKAMGLVMKPKAS